jgi:hypothetical protein
MQICPNEIWIAVARFVARSFLPFVPMTCGSAQEATPDRRSRNGLQSDPDGLKNDWSSCRFLFWREGASELFLLADSTVCDKTAIKPMFL